MPKNTATFTDMTIITLITNTFLCRYIVLEKFFG